MNRFKLELFELDNRGEWRYVGAYEGTLPEIETAVVEKTGTNPEMVYKAHSNLKPNTKKSIQRILEWGSAPEKMVWHNLSRGTVSTVISYDK